MKFLIIGSLVLICVVILGFMLMMWGLVGLVGAGDPGVPDDDD